MPVIEARALAKTYKALKKEPGISGSLKSLFSRQYTEVKAVKGIDLKVEAGERVGFLGPNGAGKTTTLKMLTGILMPSSGEAKVLGHTPFDRKPEMLRQISLLMGNKAQLWWDLPAYDGLVVLKELFDVTDQQFKERLNAMASALRIEDKLQTQIRKMSLGERMKCELIAALLHNPRVVFLDEPTLGLDVVSQKRMRDFLVDLNEKEGSTLLLTSHYMQDVAEVCERVVIIDHGEIQFDGSLSELMKTYSDARRVRIQTEETPEGFDFARYGKVIADEDGVVTLEVARREVPGVASAILQAISVQDLAIEEIPIEDVIREIFSREGG